MSLMEYYRMHIPMLLPSKELLYSFHLQYNLLCERTWECIHGHRSASSQLQRHPLSTSNISKYDPNDDIHKEAALAWLQFSDFYQWPHIIIFTSWDHLMELLRTTDFKAVGPLNFLAISSVQCVLLKKWLSHCRFPSGWPNLAL